MRFVTQLLRAPRLSWGAAPLSTKVRETRSVSYELESKPIADNPIARPLVLRAVSAEQATRVLFDNNKIVEFKNIWLRDNCKCPQCVDKMTSQKMLDTASLDLDQTPSHLRVTNRGQLIITWWENFQEHISTFDSDWLYRYGESFTHGKSRVVRDDDLPEQVLWDRTIISSQFPEINYQEVTASGSGLKAMLEMFCKYGFVVLRNVPTEHNKILDVVRLFAYVKETQYGVTFDVRHEAAPGTHPAYSGLSLAAHTDMNYREVSPGVQALHCLRALDPLRTRGGMSLFTDGFRAAAWLRNEHPSAFQALAATKLRFHIRNKGREYVQSWPVVVVNDVGDITEVHLNNRTMDTLEAPADAVIPFYRAYKLFTEKVRHRDSELRFHLAAGDLVVFNNRRILHGRTGFNPAAVTRHLVGCYADLDELIATYKALKVTAN